MNGDFPAPFPRNCSLKGLFEMKPTRSIHTFIFPVLSFLACAPLSLFCPSAFAEEAPRPNIVLIMTDDMGYSDIGCFGGEIPTPNIDRLAREGLTFTQFYNCAKCTTTRASIVTGLHPRFGGPLLRENMVTTGEVLQQAGYRTCLTGKWHLGSRSPRRPIDRGFEEFYGLMDGCCNFFNPAQRDPDYKGNRVRTFGHNDRLITEFPDDYYTTDAFTDHACEQIRRFAGEGDPFFVHVCYTAAHYPLHAWPEDIARHRGKYDDGWYALRKARHARQLESGLVDPKWELVLSDPKVEDWEPIEDKEYWTSRMEVYAAMVDRMDQGVGKILEALESTGTAENTLVLYLHDNGGCAELPEGRHLPHPPGPGDYYTSVGPGWGWAQNVPFQRYKSWVHEGGIATPLLARWPEGIESGTRTDQVGHILDLMPTFCELAGTQYPETFDDNEILPCEGISLMPVLEGKERRGHDHLCWFWAGNRSVRQGDWKAVWEKSRKKWTLYNVRRDRTETNDLAETMPEKTEALVDLWHRWADRTGLKVKR